MREGLSILEHASWTNCESRFIGRNLCEHSTLSHNVQLFVGSPISHCCFMMPPMVASDAAISSVCVATNDEHTTNESMCRILFPVNEHYAPAIPCNPMHAYLSSCICVHFCAGLLLVSSLSTSAAPGALSIINETKQEVSFPARRQCPHRAGIPRNQVPVFSRSKSFEVVQDIVRTPYLPIAQSG
ncbi:hypothetical protein B0I35DRAFT_204280 [Stachybotrys elegans]|uniref:Uncharacterized protein n=1 Tax=Stachybotrys elegans TaxID=80388 RepID=A0A8K0WTV8_9HYPO|nr:hypothetical protein B0I35DRAFT_204280 [Stachybotrys elegans]